MQAGAQQKRWERTRMLLPFQVSGVSLCSTVTVLTLSATSDSYTRVYVCTLCRTESWNINLPLHCNVILFYHCPPQLEMLQHSCFLPAAFQRVPGLHSLWPLGWPAVSVTISQLHVVLQRSSSVLTTVFSTFWKATTLYTVKNEGKEELNTCHWNDCEHFVFISYCGRKGGNRYRR